MDEFSIELSTHFPLFSDYNLESIEKEVRRSTKNQFESKKHRYVMVLLDRPLRSDISGIKDEQSYRPVYNITFQKYSTMSFLEKILEWDGSLDEFSIELSTHFPLFLDNKLDSIE